jgi:hypothetical protein
VSSPAINRRPIADAGPDQAVSTHARVTLDGSRSLDPEGDPITYRWTFTQRPVNSAAALANPSTAATSFVPDHGGTYIVSLVATDSRGAASATDTVTIVATVRNRAPVVRSTPITIASAGQAYRYAVYATDPDAGDVLTFSLSTAPAGMTVDPSSGVIDWTPAASQGGVQAVAVRATDSGGLFAVQSFAIQTSSPANQAPIANPDAYSVRVGESLAIAAPGLLRNDVDFDGQPLTSRLVSPPVNGALALNPDGSFTYTPFAPRGGELVLAQNIALTTAVPGVTAGASSSFVNGGLCQLPPCAIDGNLATFWFAFDEHPYFEVSFPQDVTVTRVRAACDELIALPTLGAIDSLNVSAAASAVLYGILQFRKFLVDSAP